MDLELAITSYQRLSPSVISRKTFATTAQCSLGRAEECDWCLPDPDRILSSRHAEIFFQDKRFWIKDTSTNGVFINGAPEPLGADGQRALSHGDHLRFGDYELGVTLVQATVPPPISAPAVAKTDQIASAVGMASDPGDSPAAHSLSGNPTLASGLNEQCLGDSQVAIADLAIPPVWQWGESSAAGSDGSETSAGTAVAPDHNEALTALFTGLGMPHLAGQTLAPASLPALLQDLGDLTRILLERVLDLLHARAAQKQKLRVQQTLFQRRENNPLKFSATAQDALEALLVRRHRSFLGPRAAVEEAFGDVLDHEEALLVGVERVIDELLQSAPDQRATAGLKKPSLLGKARAYDAWALCRARQADEFANSDAMLRSDTFVEAYEAAIQGRQRHAHDEV